MKYLFVAVAALIIFFVIKNRSETRALFILATFGILTRNKEESYILGKGRVRLSNALNLLCRRGEPSSSLLSFALYLCSRRMSKFFSVPCKVYHIARRGFFIAVDKDEEVIFRVQKGEWIYDASFGIVFESIEVSLSAIIKSMFNRVLFSLGIRIAGSLTAVQIVISISVDDPFYDSYFVSPADIRNMRDIIRSASSELYEKIGDPDVTEDFSSKIDNLTINVWMERKIVQYTYLTRRKNLTVNLYRLDTFLFK